MFENKTEEEIAIMLQEDPALLRKVKLVKKLLDLFHELTQENKIEFIEQLRPVYPDIADEFIQIMRDSDPGGADGVQSVL